MEESYEEVQEIDDDLGGVAIQEILTHFHLLMFIHTIFPLSTMSSPLLKCYLCSFGQLIY